MLIPFDRNVVSIQNLPGKYTFSVLNDLFRYDKELAGYLFCVGTGVAGYLFFKSSKMQSAYAFYQPGAWGMPQPVNFRLLLESESIDIYANILEEPTVVENLHRYFSSACTLYAPPESLRFEKVAKLCAEDSFSGIVGFHQGLVLNMAFFDRGRYRYFLYYHPDTKSFAYENDLTVYSRYLELLPQLAPIVTVRDFRLKCAVEGMNDIAVSQQKDLIVNLLLAYFDVFDFVVQELATRAGIPATAKRLKEIFDAMRAKYEPLYRRLQFSEESVSVNWTEILDDRRYVPLQYRFEHYHLYIDELAKRLIAALADAAGEAGIATVREKIAKYTTMIDSGDRDLKKMLYRLEQQCDIKA